MNVTIVDHPLVQSMLAGLRDRATPPPVFRSFTRRLSILLMAEATRGLPTSPVTVATPLEETTGRVHRHPVALVPILRAGLGMLDAAVELLPEVRVGYLGLERDEATFEPATYYANLPPLDGVRTYVLDPMLATGGSAAAAIDSVKAAGASPVRMVSIVCAPEGLSLLQERHPDVDVFTAGVDRELNDSAYILPGLGDFGDRLYGTLPRGHDG